MISYLLPNRSQRKIPELIAAFLIKFYQSLKRSRELESQTAHIVALKKRSEELTSHSKGHTQASKANLGVTKKIEIMADQIAVMATTFSAQAGLTNDSTFSRKPKVKA